MKIFAVIADSKPLMCINCILVNSCNKGLYKSKVSTHTDSMGTWETSGIVPGPECPIIVKEANSDEIKPR